MAIKTTYPYEATSPGVARYQCLECGGWERSDKNGGQIRHGKRCDSRPQFTAAQAANELTEFAANVRRTALAHGRTEDLVVAVRTGRLSVSNAMNTDD